jgi:Xaa-Pro aminopeptidase
VTVPVGLPPRPPDGRAPASPGVPRAPAFSAFGEDEHATRLARARTALRQAGFDGCVSVAPETLYYLVGYDAWVSVNSPQALIFRTDGGEPTLVLRDVDESLARETSWVRDLQIYRLLAEDPAIRIAEGARAQGLAAGRLAVELESYALPHALGLRLVRTLAPARVEDATELLGDLRLVKSGAELAYLRDAARYAGIGLETARKTLKPGITEITLAGAIAPNRSSASALDMCRKWRTFSRRCQSERISRSCCRGGPPAKRGGGDSRRCSYCSRACALGSA